MSSFIKLSVLLVVIALIGLSKADLGSTEYQYALYMGNGLVYFMKENNGGVLENRYWITAAGSGQSVNDTSVNDQKYGKRIIVIIPHMPFLLGFIEQRYPYYGDFLLNADSHCPDTDCDAQFIGYKEIITPTQAAKDIGDFIIKSNNDTVKPEEIKIIALPEFADEVKEISGYPVLGVKYLENVTKRSYGNIR